MYKKLLCLTLFTVLFGVVEAQAQEFQWIRAAYYDSRYPTNWASDADAQAVRDGLKAAGYEILNADQLKTWMTARIADKKYSVVVFCKDVAPDTVIETNSATCTLRKYLDAGGKIVFYADIPFYNQAHADGSNTNWADAGAVNILGIGAVNLWDSNATAKITAAGARWGLTQTWSSVRPIASTTAGLTVLATDNAGNAAAWVKSFAKNDTFRGFVRLWDVGGHPPVEDIIRVAEYVAVKASNPRPADGELNVTIPLLQWDASSFALWHDFYLGTSPDLGPADLKGRQILMQTMYYSMVPLEPGVTYYWRVDEVEASGAIRAGDVWNFTAQALTASGPKPANGATGEFPGLILTWLVGKDGTASHVYFGSDMAAVANGAADADQGQTVETTFDTPALRASTTYYWRVDTVKFDSSVVPGAVWSFSTADAGPTDKIVYEVWSGLGGTAVSGLTGNANYPKNPTTREYVNQFASPVDWADNYGQRLYGWLKPPETGDYTFWIAGDDEQQLWLSTDESPANGVMIANVSGWTPANDFDNTGGGSSNADAQMSDPIPLKKGFKYFIMALGKEGGGGDSTSVAWKGGPIAAREIIKAEYVDAFSLPPLQAFGPSPANGAVDTVQTLTLTWNAGEKALQHEVYFGDDAAAVGDANTSSPLFKGRQGDTSFDAGALEWGKTYYWRVDEINTGEAGSPWRGGVWSFTTANYIPVDDFESYVDDVEGRIFQTWIDGWGYTEPAPGNPGNGTSSTVGYTDPPFAETSVVHGGRQSMPFDYNNIVQPYYSETERTFAVAQNWKVNGVTDLSLWFQGYPVKFVETAAGFTMSAAGADIVNGTDEFRFAYKRLSGDGSITVKVDSVQTVSAWTKAGVMVRESLDPLAVQVHMISAAQQTLVEWMYRAITGDTTTTQFNTAAGTNPLPVWVRLTRAGNVFTGEYSANGTTWTKVPGTAPATSSFTLTMPASVYIGFVVCSQVANVSAVAQFSEVKTTGSVTGQWQTADIGVVHPGNEADTFYVALQDSAGKIAVVPNPDAQAVLSTTWTEWKIPLSSFTGVNLGSVKKMFIGVGDRKAPKADGAGKLFIDDIRVIKPAP